MTADVYSSAAIEGVTLDNNSVRSSVARHLGLSTEGLPAPGHYVDGIVEILMDAVSNANEEISEERLFRWHGALSPHGKSGMRDIAVAAWRNSDMPMQVVSGAMGKEKVHYEAPPSHAVPSMMGNLISWINSPNSVDPIIKAAIAHLWFVTIHPFDDGNGRMTRTLTDMLISRADGLPHRYYSLSAAILADRKAYYEVLERTQHGGMNITEWLIWFLDLTDKAIAKAEDAICKTLDKSMFWNQHAQTAFNQRQTKIINRLLDGFDGKLTSSKYSKICHCSTDTALRDLQDLKAKGVIDQRGEGRGTHYALMKC